MKLATALGALVLLLLGCAKQESKEISLHEMDLVNIKMGWPIPPHINKTVKGTPLTVGGKVYETGVWMNSNCDIKIVLDKTATSFTALCGPDDITLGSYKSVMEFIILADNDTTFKSGPMSAGMPAKEININLTDVDTLHLRLDSYDGNVGNDQGNWLDAKISYTGTVKPFVYYPGVEQDIDNPMPEGGYTSFCPGRKWYDTDGKHIQAHGGGLLKVNDTYYWYGEHKGGETTWWPKARVDIIGVSCYSSKDLYNWKYEGLALPAADMADTANPLHPSNVLERPKVVYNPNTKKYVMWVKSTNASYQWGNALRAISDTPAGPFTVIAYGKLAKDYKNGDFALYQEKGKGYYIWSCGEEDETTLIYSLTDDFLHTDKELTRIYKEAKREAPAIIKLEDTYYLITSGKSGWSPNPCRYAIAKSIEGPWEDKGELFVNDPSHTSFRSQSTYVLKHNGTLIYMGDRWKQRNLGDSRYIWLPIQKQGNELSIDWADEWTY